MEYTVADLESVSAVTAEFFADRRREHRFYETHCNALSGITGVWAYVRDAALILEAQSKAFGQPELAATARECLAKAKF